MRLTVVSKHLMVAAGLLAVPATIQFEQPAKARPSQKPTDQPGTTDPRSARLRQFFCSLHCPIQDLAEDFVEAADDNRLDWRLLPSISVIESGGGKVYKNNNLFGWDNGLQPFLSIRAGIHHVAFKLGKSALYRNQDALGKLKALQPERGVCHQSRCCHANDQPGGQRCSRPSGSPQEFSPDGRELISRWGAPTGLPLTSSPQTAPPTGPAAKHARPSSRAPSRPVLALPFRRFSSRPRRRFLRGA